MKQSLLSGGLIALTMILTVSGAASAARIAGMEDNTAASTMTTRDEFINPSSPASPQTVAPAAQNPPAANPSPEAKNDVRDEEKRTAPAVKKEGPKKYVTIDFDNVEMAVLVKFVSELTGKNFIIDDKVRGKVTIISPKKIPVEDVYDVFLSVLEVNGYAVVPAGNMVKIIPAALAREKSLETRSKFQPGSPDDRMVTQIVSLERANPDDIKRVLDPITPKTSSVLSYPPAGILVITDYLSNIQRLQEIISALDVEGAGEQISYIPLKNASASEVVKSLTVIFQQRQPRGTGARVVADSRTNSVILMANVAEAENVRRLVEFMDKDVPRGESNIQVYRLQNSLAEDLAKVLTNIVQGSGAATPATGPTAGQKVATPVVSKNVQVVPDKGTNTLVIMAEREDYRVLENIIRQLDVPRPMVYIEALIMEVNANKGFKLGVEWRGITEHGSVDGQPTAAFIGSGGAGTTTSPGGYNIIPNVVYDTTTGLASAAFPGGFAMGLIGAGIKIGDVIFPSIGAVVQAYKTDSEVSILSTPQIMTLDNEEAEINVGENVPYVTRQDQTASGGTVPVNYSQYEYRDVGVVLNITPHINEEDFIRLKISQQVTKVVSTGADPKVATPTTLKRTVKTSVVVKDKETVVIGGLIGDSTADNNYKVPFLGEIPILGWLFKTNSKSREKTNLYVFITPHIVRTRDDAAGIYQQKRDSMGEVVEGVIRLNEKRMDDRYNETRSPVIYQSPANP